MPLLASDPIRTQAPWQDPPPHIHTHFHPQLKPCFVSPSHILTPDLFGAQDKHQDLWNKRATNVDGQGRQLESRTCHFRVCIGRRKDAWIDSKKKKKKTQQENA